MRLLLAEDEKELSRALQAILNHSGYAVDAVYNGQEAVEQAGKNAYDAMIFDIMMPVMDGITALKTLREQADYTPVLLLTAKAEVDDRITGLDAGADDYLTKPFAMGELLARIRSMTRRNDTYTQKKLTVGSVILDTSEQSLSCENSIRLANKEVKLAELFMNHAGIAISTEEILDKIWNNDGNGKAVWMYVCFLNSKLQSINADITISGEENGSFTLYVVGESA
ncbi:MAG TPA: DNA-binding response regulator [Ruminococcus sp.]|nr:DNA-binding response regulator [Ruminococcus sp.]